MKLAIIGSGYVGLVTGACLAQLGNEVICVDKEKKRLATLAKGEIPFYEPGLSELVTKGVKDGKLSFSGSVKQAALVSEVVFICVGTPPKEDGEADISGIFEVAREIAAALKGKRPAGNAPKIIVNKSTVPVGTGDQVAGILQRAGVSRKLFSIVSNPEFLRQGVAVKTFMNPDRVVIGASSDQAFDALTEIYRPLNAHVICTSLRSAELIKYTANAFLAAKISFANEIANICELLGSDVTEVTQAVGLDKRIGRDFLNAGLGYGGSCLPKDISALIHIARQQGYDPELLSAVNELNKRQISRFFEKIDRTLNGVNGKVITLLGLSFKPDTDDLRDAPSLKLLDLLVDNGARIRLYDPTVAKGKISRLKDVRHCQDVYKALEGSEAMVVVTEWQAFRELDLARARRAMKKNYIFDGRNIFDPRIAAAKGFRYFGVGR